MAKTTSGAKRGPEQKVEEPIRYTLEGGAALVSMSPAQSRQLENEAIAGADAARRLLGWKGAAAQLLVGIGRDMRAFLRACDTAPVTIPEIGREEMDEAREFVRRHYESFNRCAPVDPPERPAADEENAARDVSIDGLRALVNELMKQGAETRASLEAALSGVNARMKLAEETIEAAHDAAHALIDAGLDERVSVLEKKLEGVADGARLDGIDLAARIGKLEELRGPALVPVNGSHDPSDA